MFRNDRKTGNKGGGVLLYAKYNLDPVQPLLIVTNERLTFVPQTNFLNMFGAKLNRKMAISCLLVYVIIQTVERFLVMIRTYF